MGRRERGNATTGRTDTKGFTTDKGRLVKSVGWALTKGGTVQPRRFYLGTDADAARATVARIRAAWAGGEGTREIDVAGRLVKVWADGADPAGERGRIDAGAAGVDRGADGATGATGTATAAGPTTGKAHGSLTVGEAAATYLANIRTRYLAGQVSHAHWSGGTFSLQRGLDLLGRETPLASVGKAELTLAVLDIAGRPFAKMTPGRKVTGKRIGIVSAKVYIASLKAFLVEMSKTETAPGSEIPVWRKPLTFEDIFRDNQPTLTADEKHKLISQGGAEAGAFTVDEVRTIYSGAGDRQRLWLLLALNCGFGPMELATLTVQQINDLNPGDAVATDGVAVAPVANVKRFRGKTDVYAEWELWPETAALLRKFVKKDKRTCATDLAIVTDDGKPLVAPRGMGRRDAVRSAWVNTVAVLPVERRLPFKYLRKTGARLVRHSPIGGDAVAEMYLSHADDKSGILNAYSGRPWAKLAAALVELRRELFGDWQAPIRKLPRGRGAGAYVQLATETPIGV